jgi:integrase
LLIAQSENIKQSQLGHASIQTTLDRYGHLLPTTHKEAAQRLDQHFLAHPLANH